jgi:hypothetical protein
LKAEKSSGVLFIPGFQFSGGTESSVPFLGGGAVVLGPFSDGGVLMGGFSESIATGIPSAACEHMQDRHAIRI